MALHPHGPRRAGHRPSVVACQRSGMGGTTPGRVPMAVFRAADGAILPIHVSGAAAGPVLRGSVPHGQRGGGRRSLLVRTVSLRSRPHAVWRRSGRDAVAGGKCRPRRGHARLPLLVLHPDHRRHHHRVERRAPYQRHSRAWIPYGDHVHDAGLLPLLCVVPFLPARGPWEHPMSWRAFVRSAAAGFSRRY